MNSLSRTLFRSVLLSAALLFPVVTFAATSEFKVLLDVDNNASTGCSVTLPGGDTFPGVEQVLTTTVTTTDTAAAVTLVTRQQCTDPVAGTFGSPITIDDQGWPAGYDPVTGNLLVETYLPVSALSSSYPMNMHIGFVASSGFLMDAVATGGDGKIILFPTHGPRRRIVNVDPTERVITLDGLGADWGLPISLGAGSSTSAALRIINVYAYGDSENFFFRFDVQQNPNAPTANDDSYSVQRGHALNVTAPGVLGNDTDPKNAPLSAILLNGPQHGTLSLQSDGGFNYLNDGSSAPSDSFRYKASNGTLQSNPATVTLDITAALPTNHPPVAVPDLYNVAHSGTLTVPAPGLLSNDFDIDSNPLHTVLATSPHHGTLTLNSNGSFTYVHDGSNSLIDTFTYRATDSSSSSAPALVTITIGPDVATTAVNDAYTVAEGGTLSIAAPGVMSNDTDPDTPQAFRQAILVTGPTHGTLTLNTNGSFTYVHDGSETTADSFTYKVNDGISDSNTATVSITVTPVNDAPVAANDAYTTPEDQTLVVPAPGVLGNDSDADSATITAILVTGPAHGSLTLNADGSFTYIPNANYNGLDSFTYKANDGSLSSANATVSITVTAVNDAPVNSVPAAQSTNEDTPLTLSGANAIQISDVDAGAGSMQIDVTVTNGTLTLVAAAGATVSNNGTAHVTATGTLAALNAALNGLVYTPSQDYNGSDSIQIVTNDNGNTGAGGPLTDTDSVAVTINAVNDAPVVTAGATLAFTENQGATVIDNTVTVDDVDNATLASATVQISANYVSGEDILSFANTANITGSFNAATGTLTLTGSDTLANYQAALRSVEYNNTSDNPTTSPRTVSWTVNDGSVNSNTATSTINITAVDDAPVVTAGATLAYTENQAATAIDTTVTVSDVDSTNLASATVQITANYVNGEDVLAFANTASITGSFNAATGTLILTGSDTVAHYQAALRSVTYVNTSDNPSSASRTVTWIVNDGTATSAPVTSTITVTPVNDAPVVIAGHTVTYTENGAAVTLEPALTVTDADSTTIQSAQVVVSGNADLGNDVLACPACGGTITASFNSGSDTLTLTGTDTVANYQSVMRSVTFSDLSDNPIVAPRYIDWFATDSSGAQSADTVANDTHVNVIPVNDAPVATAGGTLSYTENQAATAIDATVTVSDVDNTNLASATVQITANYVNGQDLLAFANTANITGSFNAATGTLTLTGSDTLANYQAALRSVTYFNTSDNPSGAPRTVTWIVNDGALNSSPVTSNITVTPVNDAPVVVAGNTITYTENGAPIAVDATVTISDADSTMMQSALVVVSGNADIGKDVLACPACGGTITASFSSASDTLTLTGTDTIANYQAALRSVTYANSSDNPSTAQRGIDWFVTDNSGAQSANTAANDTVINVIAVNDPPVVTAGGTLAYTENQAATAIDTTVTVSDVDSASLASATVQITANYVSGQDVLSFTNTANITGSFNTATGTLTLTGSDTVANYQAALRAVKYNNTSENPVGGSRTVTWTVNDGALNSAPATSTITVTPVNDAPVITAGATLAYTENQAPAVIDNTITVSDVDNTTLASATVQITANYANGQDVLSFANTANITASFNAATGTLTLTGSDTPANYQAALRSVKYANSSDSPSAAPRTVSWIVNDGTANSNTATSTITVTPVNDAPVITAGGTLSYIENQAATAIDNTITVSDSDNTNLASATAQVTANYVIGQDTLSFTNTANITGSFNLATGTLTLTGSDTLANYQAALRSVKYNNTSENPSAATRTVSWTVNDGTANSNTATSTITVTPIDDAPVITAGATLAYTENQAATVIDNTITVNDADNASLASATVQITANYVNGEDVLSFANTANITGSFNAATGTLTLTGSDTVANYQAALRSVKYVNTSDNPSTAPRTVSWTVSDGALTSNTATSTITITPVDDAPVVTAGGTLAYVENQAAAVIDNTITVSDSDNTNLASATAQITGNYANGQDILSFSNTANITGTFTAATGTLTLTGSDTVANYQAALRSVKYNNTSDDPSPLTRTVTWIANDGTASSAAATSTITVQAVNDAPVITRPASFTAQAGTPFTLTGANQISVADIDAESGNVTVTLTVTQGVFNLGSTTGLTVTGNGTASVTATGTLTNINNGLNNSTYTGTFGYGGPDTLTIVANDNGNTGSGGAQSDTKTTNITVVNLNQPPVNSIPGTQTVNEDAVLTFSSSNSNAITISDPDAGAANVQINLTATNGVLSLGSTTGLTVTGNGTASVQATGLIAAINAGLDGTTYTPTANYNGSATITVVTDDLGNTGTGGAQSDTDVINITVAPVNDAPAVTRPASITVAEDSAFTFTVGANGISVADIDAGGGNVTVTVTATNGIFTLSGTTGLTVTGNGTASVSLTGTLSAVNAALANATYQGNANYNGPDTITVVANDNGNSGSGGALSDTKTISVTVTPVNDAPVLAAGGGTPTFTEDGGAVTVDGGITASDIDSANMASATVTISNLLDAGQETLAATTTGTSITASYNGATGVLTLSNSDTIAHYQQVLRSVTYNNASQNPTTTSRVINFKVNDGSLDSNVVSTSVTIVAVNDAPVLANGGSTLAYVENGAPAVINGGITVTDVDSTNLIGATVTISNNFQAGKDELSYATALGITGSFNSSTGVLTLIGTTTVANYQTALRNVKYDSTSEDPSTLARTVTFQVNDGGAVNNLSNTVTSTINVTNVNDAPTANAFTGLPAQAGIPITYPAGKLGGSDNAEEAANGSTVSIVTTADSVTGGTVTINADGSFTFTPLPSTAGGSASFTYHVKDTGNPGPGINSSSVTVSFNVAGPAIYFVKLAGAGNCTLGSECTLATALTNIGAATNAIIFISDANTHTPASAITLNSGGSIIGQGITAASFDTFFGIGTPAQGTLAARPAINQARPTVAGAITMNTNSMTRGFNMSNTSGETLTASSKTGLVVSEMNVTTSTNNSSQYAVHFSSSSGTFTFGDITVSGSNSGAGVNFATTTSSSTVTFNNITTHAGLAFTTSSTGSTSFTVNDVSSTSGGAVNVATGTGAFTFHSLAANGAANGILISGETGSFTVNGTSATSGTGGTIQNCSAKGADVRSSSNVTFKNMNFTGNGTSNMTSATTCGDALNGTNGPTNCNGNIVMSSVTTTVLNNVTATNSAQIGIDVNGGSGLTLTSVVVTGNGNEVDEDGVQIAGLTGTLTVSGGTFKDNAANEFEVQNGSGTLTINVDNATFSNTNFPLTATNPSNTTANGGLFVGSHGTAVINPTVTNSTFDRIYSAAFRADMANSSTMTVRFGPLSGAGNGNNVSNAGNGFAITGTNTSGATYSVRNNNFQNNTAVTTGTFATTVVSASKSNVGGTWDGTISGNIIGTAGTVKSGCEIAGCDGIFINNTNASGIHRVNINSNAVHDVAGSGIHVLSGGGTDTSSSSVSIQNNTITNPDQAAGAANPGLYVQSGSLGTDATNTCASITGNNITGTWSLGTSHLSSIRVRSLAAGGGSFAVNGFNAATEYPNSASAQTSCTGNVGTVGNVADYLRSANPSVPNNPDTQNAASAQGTVAFTGSSSCP